MHSAMLKIASEFQSVLQINTVSDEAQIASGWPGWEGIWCCSHTNHYKLTHTLSRCIPTHISLISHASLSLMQLPDDMRANTGCEDALMLQIESVISKPIHSARYLKKKKYVAKSDERINGV
jgi:hypothetical protein